MADLRAAAARDGGLRRLSAMTAALALASVVGTGVVVKEARAFTIGAHSTTSPTAQTSARRSDDDSGGGSGLQAPASAPTTQQAPPVTVSSGS